MHGCLTKIHLSAAQRAIAGSVCGAVALAGVVAALVLLFAVRRRQMQTRGLSCSECGKESPFGKVCLSMAQCS
jgi:hypothetical protein